MLACATVLGGGSEGLWGGTGEGFEAPEKRHKTISVLWMKVYENVTFWNDCHCFISKQILTNLEEIYLPFNYFFHEIMQLLTAEAILS